MHDDENSQLDWFIIMVDVDTLERTKQKAKSLIFRFRSRTIRDSN